MADLKLRVLAYLENHNKAMVETIIEAFSHEQPQDIEDSLLQLASEGWVKLKESFMLDGNRVKKRIAYRTQKQLYTQPYIPKLIDEENLINN